MYPVPYQPISYSAPKPAVIFGAAVAVRRDQHVLLSIVEVPTVQNPIYILVTVLSSSRIKTQSIIEMVIRINGKP